MAVPPTAPNLADGLLTSSALNDYIIALGNFLADRPACTARQTSAQSIANNTWTALTFDAEDFDFYPTGGAEMHSTSSNTSRFTIVHNGVYLFTGASTFSTNGTGSRGARWAINGSVANHGGPLIPTVAATFGTVVAAAGLLVALIVGDYVELQAYQNSGGALNTQVAAGGQSFVSAAFTRR